MIWLFTISIVEEAENLSSLLQVCELTTEKFDYEYFEQGFEFPDSVSLAQPSALTPKFALGKFFDLVKLTVKNWQKTL